jgi:hypothetical protein
MRVLIARDLADAAITGLSARQEVRHCLQRSPPSRKHGYRVLQGTGS